MNPPKTRIEELILTSDIQRELARLEVDVLRFRIGQLELRCRQGWRVARWVVPLMGLWVGRRARRGRFGLASGSIKWLTLLKLWQWWRAWRSRA